MTSFNRLTRHYRWRSPSGAASRSVGLAVKYRRSAAIVAVAENAVLPPINTTMDGAQVPCPVKVNTVRAGSDYRRYTIWRFIAQDWPALPDMRLAETYTKWFVRRAVRAADDGAGFQPARPVRPNGRLPSSRYSTRRQSFWFVGVE